MKGYLRPSRELLEYYRKKIGEYDIEREDIMKKIDKFKNALEDQVQQILFIFLYSEFIFFLPTSWHCIWRL